MVRGRLECDSAAQAAVVRQHLPRHIELTCSEAGCLRFDGVQTDDLQVWHVDEAFLDAAAFEAHRQRVADSEWGRVTQGIRRSYTVHERE
ncbi:antibiotic biosynthesis monooxygenase [Williamsia sp. CHRR-6]|nr:antibiotic biosynthesis monooxygenase [Williamsia sp. CHRR-6]